MSEPRWLTSSEAIAINKEQIALTLGEKHFLRDAGALESAIAAPRNYWIYEEQDLNKTACVLIRSLGRAHAFEQGNKRTAFFAGTTFLGLNGAYVDLPDTEMIARVFEDLILGKASLEQAVGFMALAVVIPEQFK